LPLGLRSLEPAANEKGRDVKLEADDVVFLYTDGLTEAGRDVIAGESQLCDLLARTNAATSVENIYDRAIALTSAGTASDDVAILMARMLSVRDESEAELSGFVTTTKAAKA
jgi:serine phosphatase RsbU (regulator of sigma subunit)